MNRFPFFHCRITLFSLLFIVFSSSTINSIGTKNINSIISVGGTVWEDSNENGIFDPEEHGISIIKLGIFNESSNIVLGVTLTDDSGNYLFEGLESGNYTIVVLGENFNNGILSGFNSSPGQEDADNDEDNDDNGDDDLANGSGTTTIVLLQNQEPDGNLNTTIDFGFAFSPCNGIPLSQPSCELLESTLPYTDGGDLLCDLYLIDSYCSTMPTTPLVEPAPSPLCPSGGTATNMLWFSFIAGEGIYSIVVTPYNCQPAAGQTDIGIQTGIYTDCTFSNALICNSECSTNADSLSSTVLTPGETYYIFIDGCSGSVCDFDVSIVGEFTPFNIPEPTSLTCTNIDCDQTFLEGQEVELFVEGLDLNLLYNWEIPIGVNVLSSFTSDSTTNENILNLSFPNAGVYTICMTEATNNCSYTSTPVCIDISIEQCPTLIIDHQSFNVSCFDQCDGTISIHSVNNAIEPIQYLWSNGSTSTTINDLCADTYSITITDSLNCSIIDSIHITQPNIISFIVDSITHISDNQLGSIQISSNNNGNYSFAWAGPDGFISSSEDLFNLEMAGCYDLNISNNISNCNIDTSICIVNMSAVNNYEKQKLNIYPNPAVDIVQISLPNSSSIITKIQIYDIKGKKIKEIIPFTNSNNIAINIKDVNIGLYILIAISKEGTHMGQLIID